MTTTRARLPLATLLCVVGIQTGTVLAQDLANGYPNRPIKIVVPFTPGGLPDVLARTIGEKFQAAWNLSVVVENKPGAGTLIAAEYVAKSPADGYTLLLASTSTLGISPVLYSNPPIDAVKDFAPISLLGLTNLFLITSPAFPARNVKELIALVRQNPGRFNYASPGSGTPHHLFMEVLKKELGLDITHIPYKGTALAIPDVISGQVQMMFCDAVIAVPQIKAGKVNGLGTSMAKQTTLASVPPIAASVPGFDWQGWMGLVAPAATPKPIIAKLFAQVQRIQGTSEYRELIVKFGMEPAPPATPEQFAEYIRTGLGRWAAAVRTAGVQVD